MPEAWNQLALPDLYASLADTGLVGRLLELARDEDLGPEGRDLTGEATRPGTRPGPNAEESTTAAVVARQAGVVAGLATIPELLSVFGVSVTADLHAGDGDIITPGDTLATLTGPLDEIVRVERTLLNLVGRLSGVATRTATFVRTMRAAGDTPARLYDTRKTTPGLRVLEKYAVRCGGGCCHRMGLHDAVMFKDNHIAGVPTDRLAAHARSLVDRVRTRAAETGATPAFIEFEVDTLDQLDALLTVNGENGTGPIDVILLDNMPPAELAEAVARRDRAGSAVLLEASGGVTLETVAAIARTGVDRVSVGSLTHGAVSLDVGLDSGPGVGSDAGRA